jgi:hypothetical protein
LSHAHQPVSPKRSRFPGFASRMDLMGVELNVRLLNALPSSCSGGSRSSSAPRDSAAGS